MPIYRSLKRSCEVSEWFLKNCKRSYTHKVMMWNVWPILNTSRWEFQTGHLRQRRLGSECYTYTLYESLKNIQVDSACSIWVLRFRFWLSISLLRESTGRAVVETLPALVVLISHKTFQCNCNFVTKLHKYLSKGFLLNFADLCIRCMPVIITL